MACLINKHIYGQISNVTLMPYSVLFFSVGREINPVLDAKKHVCARRDKSHLESRFINIIKGKQCLPYITETLLDMLADHYGMKCFQAKCCLCRIRRVRHDTDRGGKFYSGVQRRSPRCSPMCP